MVNLCVILTTELHLMLESIKISSTIKYEWQQRMVMQERRIISQAHVHIM